MAIDLRAGQPRTNRGPLAEVQRSSDIAWLERIASSDAFAHEVQRSSPIGMAKLLRGAAYARLGEIGTSDSLEAVERVERAMAEVPLTPATVPLGQWPSIGWHMSDGEQRPLARAAAPDGTIYAVVIAQLLGGDDFFL